MGWLGLRIAILAMCFGGTVWAKLDLIVLWPHSGFTTNNREVRIQGYLSASEGQTAIVTFSTPAGVDDLAAGYPALQAFSLDLGSRQTIAAVAFVPLQAEGLFWGPRRVRLAFSDDGQQFSAPITLVVPLGSDQASGLSPVSLPSPQQSRYLRVEILEGWQAGQVRIHRMNVFNPEGAALRARVASVSVHVSLGSDHRGSFETSVPLRDGENRIMVQAQLEVAPFDPREHADTEVIQLTRIGWLSEGTASQGMFDLSDGWQIELIAPVDAFPDTVRGLEMLPVPPEAIPRYSYRNHRQMVPQATPVVAYQFRIAHRTTFPTQATAFLETQPPQLAVDGRLEYPSTWITSQAPLPVSLTVDLTEIRKIGEIRVHAHVDEKGRSFGPERATLLVSTDGQQYREIYVQESFQDRTTPIVLPEPVEARYVRMRIEESKQASNIQINEVEFFDESGNPIVPLISTDRLTLERPVVLRLFYRPEDLDRARVSDPRRLACFLWIPEERDQGFWQFIGGQVSVDERSVAVQLNHLARVALFETVPMTIGAVWRFNPFSPDGNGIADTTGLTLHVPLASPEHPVEVSVTLFDLSGRRVRDLLEREPITTQTVYIEWDGTDRTGRIVPIGPYIYQVQTENQQIRGTIVVAK